jgi:hypothetical protein
MVGCAPGDGQGPARLVRETFMLSLTDPPGGSGLGARNQSDVTYSRHWPSSQ